MSEFKLVDSDVKPDHIIDARDLNSPVPLLRLKRELALLRSKEIVQINCTDPGSRTDISGWCSRTKNLYLGEKKENLFFSFFISKK